MAQNPSSDDFHKRNKNIGTLFYFLKNNKDDQFVEYIMSLDDDELDVNVKDDNGNMLIFFIVMNNKKRLLMSIIERKAKLDVFDVDGRSVMFYPIKFNHQDIIDLLIDVDKKNIGLSLVNTKDVRGNTPIYYAIKFSNKNALQDLLTNGADANIKNNIHFNALHMAVKKRDITMVNMIVKYISNINSRTKENGSTALHYACNFGMCDVAKVLIDHGAQVNMSETNNDFYPIFYSVILNDYDTAMLLIDSGFNPNNTDVLGNTLLHYAIIHNSIEILDYAFQKYPIIGSKIFIQTENTISKENRNVINPNMSNIDGQTILHLLIENYIPEYEKYISMLIPKTNLNIQNNKGNTIIHLLVSKNILSMFKKVLVGKKINLYIQNLANETVIDSISKSDVDWFVHIVAGNYLMQLTGSPGKWNEKWQNDCSLRSGDRDACISEIQKMIVAGKPSIPIRKDTIVMSFNELNKVEMSTFVGSKLDIITGVKYLTDKYPQSTSIYHKNRSVSDQLASHHGVMGTEENKHQFIIQIEIIWSYQKLFAPPSFDSIITNVIKKNKHRFIIIPIGIILSNGQHSNMLIYDIQNKTIERFEPHGSGYPNEFNYNPDLLDDDLKKLMSFILQPDQITYLKPNQYMPKIGFHAYENIDIETNRHIGDPKGFCTVWCIWYTDYRLKYYNESPKRLVSKLLTEIKLKGLSFRTMIRNYSKEITDYRDKYLTKINKTINDFINNKLSQSDLDALINDLLVLTIATL